ncbi:hypothetical protein GGI12_004408 [Dipsacomyces acuminosporus]|nr:hypothetical protein GGI12_004408 [Dipsacomyces acuminosporus]
MEYNGERPITYLGILERTPEVPILYISSSVRDALLFEPNEIIGQSAKDFVADNGDGEELKREHGSYSDDNVIITRKTTKEGERVLYKSRDDSGSRPSGSLMDASNTYQNIINSMKKPRQACIVLEDLKANNASGKPGARIIFTTDSINRILDVDSCDLQGMPFLSLVALEDTTRAANFLDKASNSNALALENLRLLVNPLENGQLGYPKTVSVEFMAMGSDDGAIMLCQLKQPVCDDGNEGYMSLEDIISSDPETSDFIAM